MYALTLAVLQRETADTPRPAASAVARACVHSPHGHAAAKLRAPSRLDGPRVIGPAPVGREVGWSSQRRAGCNQCIATAVLRRCAVHSHLRDQRIGSTNRDTSGAARSHATGKGGLGGRHKTGYLPSYKRLLAPPQPRDDPTHRRRRYRPLRHPPRRLKSHRLASSAPAPPALPCGLEAQ